MSLKSGDIDALRGLEMSLPEDLSVITKSMLPMILHAGLNRDSHDWARVVPPGKRTVSILGRYYTFPVPTQLFIACDMELFVSYHANGESLVPPLPNLGIPSGTGCAVCMGQDYEPHHPSLADHTIADFWATRFSNDLNILPIIYRYRMLSGGRYDFELFHQFLINNATMLHYYRILADSMRC